VLDYEKLPFKCGHCHGYGHFSRYCKRKAEEGVENAKGDQWTQVQKSTSMKQKNKIKGKGVPTGSGTPPIAQGEGSIVPPRVDTSTNPFETLSTSEKLPELAEEEVEQQAIAMEEDK